MIPVLLSCALGAGIMRGAQRAGAAPGFCFYEEQTLLQPLFCHRVLPGEESVPDPPSPGIALGACAGNPPPGGMLRGCSAGLSQAHVKEFVFSGWK